MMEDGAGSVQPPPGALCLRCNYELRDLTEHRCPECGQVFDPTRLDTMNLGRPLGAFARFALGPVSWPTILAFGVPTLFVLMIAIEPTCYFLLGEIALLVLYALSFGAIVGVRGLVRMGVAGRHRQPAPRSFWRDPRGRCLFTLLLVMIVAVVLKLPLYAGFWVSKPWLDDLAAECRRDANAFEQTLPRRAGLYVIDRSSLESDVVTLFTSSHSDGFIHDPYAHDDRPGFLSPRWSWFTWEPD